MEKKERNWNETFENFNELIKAQKYTEANELADTSEFTL